MIAMKTHPFALLFSGIILLTLAGACRQDTGKRGDDPAATGHAPDPGIGQLNQLIEQSPDDPALHFQRALAYYDLEGYDEALRDVETALSYDSTNAEYLHLLADVYLDYYQSFKALKTMERAASLHPERIHTLLKLSEFQLILQQPEEALKTLGRIRAIDPQNAEMFYMAGLVLEDMGKIDEAISNYQSAVEIDPELIEGWINLGKLWALKEQPIAIQFFDNALRVDSNHVVALYEKANYLYNQLGDPAGALALYRKIAQIQPKETEPYFYAGIMYLEMDSLSQAVKEFDISIQTDPTFSRAYYYRGLCREMTGNPENARADYEQALNLEPELEAAREALNRLK